MIEDNNKTREQLLIELSNLRRENSQLRKLPAEPNRAEVVLQESERRYRELADLLPETVVEFDESSNFTFVNLHGLEMFGYTKDDIETGLNVLQTIAPEDHAKAKEAVEKVLRGEKSSGSEYAMIKKDGGRFLAFIHGSLIIRDNKVEGLRAIVVDITERKRAEEALRESREQFKAMFETASIGIGQADPQTGQFLRVNQKICDITGYSSDELLAMRFHEITHPEDREQDREAFQGVVNGKSPDYRTEKRYIRKDGQIIWVNLNMTVIRDVAGQPVRTVATVEDITGRRRAEEQIGESLHEKEVLLKEIHHRVKNNLQVISSLLNMQIQYIHDPKDAELFKASKDRVKSMALIHDKLYRSENLASIHFPGYVNDLARALFASYAMDKGVELDLQVDPISLNIDNAIPLGLIINELVSNALKHAFPGRIGGTITIKLQRQADQMLLTVSDNGIGFPEEMDFTNTKSLGMQLVVTLVEQLEGSILLDRDGGTGFRMVFEASG